MNRDRQRNYDLEALEEVIATLKEASDLGAAIIVEGPKDVDSLRHLGIDGAIIIASQRSPLTLAEETANVHRDIVLLTDWDDRGEELAQLLDHYLRPTSSHVDLEIRRHLKALVRKEIKDVESLFRYVEKVREICGSMDLTIL